VHWADVEIWNRAAFLAMNAGEGAAVWAVGISGVLASDLIYAIPVLLVTMWLWGDHRLRRAALRSCVVAGLALGAGLLVGIVWPHPRPFVIGLGHAWIPHAADASFPSDHVTLFSAVGLCMLVEGQSVLGLTLLAAGACVGWARIYLGVHFPLDIAGAVVLAAVTCAVVAPAWRRVGDRLTDQVQQVYRKVMMLPIARGWVRP
jgi:undecaprenyl-diphosphatase